MPALTNLKVQEVSFCKKGMNQHARVALFKSLDSSPRALAKATFQEALEGNMIAGAVNDAFYQSFDGLWERNDAFRAALADEFAEGGDGTQASAAYVASVKALVDEAVANARAAGATAADTSNIDKAFGEAVSVWLTKLNPEEHTTMNITTKAQLLAAVAKFDPAKSPASEITVIQKAATDLGAEDALPAEGLLALAKTDNTDDLRREITILKMAPVTKTYFDGLDDAGKTAFLAKSEADQAADVEKANATDPVVHKCKDGTEIRKSDGPTTLAMAKRLDGLEAENAALKKSQTEGTLETRAAAYPNVAKATAIDLLKSADAVGVDTDAGKSVLKTLSTMNASKSGVFKTLGSTEGDAAVPGDLAKAQGDFNGAVNKIMERDKCDRPSAMSKARAEHVDLFKAAFPGSVEEDEEQPA